MDAYTSRSWPASVLASDRRIPLLAIFLFVFVVAAVSVTAMVGFNWAVWIMGILCAAAFLIDAVRGQLRIAPEVWLYTAFVGWAMLGVLNVRYAPMFWTQYFSLVQFAVLLLMVSHYAANQRTVHVLLVAVALGTLAVVASGLLSGQYEMAQAGRQRISGMARNANQYAVNVIQAAAMLLYAFHVRKGLLGRGVIILLMLCVVTGLIASGSRTGLLGFVCLLAVWFTLVYVLGARKGFGGLLGGLMLMGVVGGVLATGLSGSLLAKRLHVITQELAEGIRENSAIVRFQLYWEGLAMLVDHPLTGVGAGQFVVATDLHLYAHCNYVEVFASTGLPGGLLFYSIYLLIALRLRRLRRWCESDPRSLALIKLFQTVLITTMVMEISHVSWADKSTWVLLSIMIGWSFHTEQRLRSAAAWAGTDSGPPYAPAPAYGQLG